MKKLISKLLVSPTRFLCTLALCNVAMIFVGWLIGISENNWPGWVQGIGSVEAILVAVWVTWHQTHSQRRVAAAAEAEEVAGLLRSFRSEIEISVEQADRTIGPKLDSTSSGQGFYVTYPVPEDPFVIYNGLIPKLGLIRDEQLSHRIVRAYAAGKSFVLTIRYNNELIAKVEDAIRSSDAAGEARARRGVDQYGDAVRFSWKTAKDEIIPALNLLRSI